MGEKLYSWRYVKNNIGIYRRYNIDTTPIFVTIQNPNRKNGKITLFIEDIIQVASNECWEEYQFEKIYEAKDNYNLVYWSATVDKVNN